MAEQQRTKYNSITTVLAKADVKNKNLAAYLHVTPQWVSKWVTNTNLPSIQWFYKIVGFLDVDVRAYQMIPKLTGPIYLSKPLISGKK